MVTALAGYQLAAGVDDIVVEARMIRVNDKWDIAWRPEMTVNNLLDACGFTHRYLVVTINGTLVPPEEYATQTVSDGDQVRVVHVLAGG